MSHLRSTIGAAILGATLSITAFAQTTVQTGSPTAKSPHVKTTWTISDATVSIEYGRPYLKGRDEATMMPQGKPWRTGADVATIITSDKPLTFGSVKLAPGSYTINTQPGATEWQLILGTLKDPKQWGVPYQPDLELGRTPMKLSKTAAPVEQVTIAIDTAASGPTLRIEWGTVSVTAPFTVGK